MPTVELSSSNFVETVSRKGIVLVECWATWCGGCKTFGPTFEKFAAAHPEYTFGTLDADKAADIVEKLGLQHVPAVLLYRDGLLLFQESGSFAAGRLKNILQQAERLDMDAIRAEIRANAEAETESAASRSDAETG